MTTDPAHITPEVRIAIEHGGRSHFILTLYTLDDDVPVLTKECSKLVLRWALEDLRDQADALLLEHFGRETEPGKHEAES